MHLGQRHGCPPAQGGGTEQCQAVRRRCVIDVHHVKSDGRHNRAEPGVRNHSRFISNVAGGINVAVGNTMRLTGEPKLN